MNEHETAIKLRQIANDILTASASEDNYINHIDVLRMTAVVVEAIMRALNVNDGRADIRMQEYRNAFVALLDGMIVKMGELQA